MTVPVAAGDSGDVVAIRRTRVAVFVGDAGAQVGDAEPDGTELDFALPSSNKLIAVVEDLKDAVAGELARRRLPGLDPKATYVLCDADGRPFDVEKTLDQCEVYDGYSLWLLPQEASERHTRVIERVSTAMARSAQEQFRVVDPAVTRRMGSALLVALVVWAALIVAKLWWDTRSWIPAAVCAAMAAALAGAGWIASGSPSENRRHVVGPLSWAAVLAAAAAAAMAIPGAPSGWHLAAGAVTLLLGVLVLSVLGKGRYPAAVAFTVTVALVGLACAVVRAWLHVPADRLAASVLTVVVVLVTWASNIGGASSGAPQPSFPSMRSRRVFERLPNRPRKSVSPIPSGTVITGALVARWARQGTLTMTGVTLAAAVLLVVGCRWVVIPGQPWAWRNLVFAVGICVVVLLWARSMIDRVQSVSLTVGVVLGIAVVLGRYAGASTPATVAMTLACAGLVMLLAAVVVWSALWLPDAAVKAPVRRAVMGLQLVLTVVLTGPWMLWLWNTYSHLKHLRH